MNPHHAPLLFMADFKKELIILRVVRYNCCNCQTGLRTLRRLLNFIGTHSEKIMGLLGCRMQNVYRKVLRNYDFNRGVNIRRKQMHYIILWGYVVRSYRPVNLRSGPEEIHRHVQNTPSHPVSDREAKCGSGLMSCINHSEATLPVTFSHTVGRNAFMSFIFSIISSESHTCRRTEGFPYTSAVRVRRYNAAIEFSARHDMLGLGASCTLLCIH